MALLHSQAKGVFLVDFYHWNAHDQQGYLDWYFGAVGVLSASDEPTNDMTIPLDSENGPPARGHEEAAIVPRDRR